jgi:ubiquinone/menaquinone biosynthesis C-methylase UbiE
MLFQPHYVRDYRRMVRVLMRNHPVEDAMARAVGGDYEIVGRHQVDLFRAHGLRDCDYLVDVGCGSGRTAYALRTIAALGYHGIDVVPELLAYAEQKVARPDWKFSLVEGLSIPEPDARVDMVAMFSVLTHLSPAEGPRYLADAARVLKPGGKIIASFLDSSLEMHRAVAGRWINQVINRWRAESVKNVLLDRGQLSQCAASLGLRVEFFGPERIGQSYFVLKK